MVLRNAVTAYGLVQGVGFRFFVSYTARRLLLTGWVANLEDGRVSLEAEGEEENLRVFLEALREGNGFCRVAGLETRRIPPEGGYEFQILDEPPI